MNEKIKKIRPLGKLEQKVMDILWVKGSLSVREVNQRLRDEDLAHTTVMTTLDRLYKKGFLFRQKEGISYIYSCAITNDTYQYMLVESAISGLISGPDDSSPVLAAFVDAATKIDSENLSRLEILIAQRKRSGD